MPPGPDRTVLFFVVMFGLFGISFLVMAHAIHAKNRSDGVAARAPQLESPGSLFVTVVSLIGLAVLVFFAWADATSPLSTVGEWFLAVGGSAVKLAVGSAATSLLVRFFSEGRTATSNTR